MMPAAARAFPADVLAGWLRLHPQTPTAPSVAEIRQQDRRDQALRCVTDDGRRVKRRIVIGRW